MAGAQVALRSRAAWLSRKQVEGSLSPAPLFAHRVDTLWSDKWQLLGRLLLTGAELVCSAPCTLPYYMDLETPACAAPVAGTTDGDPGHVPWE